MNQEEELKSRFSEITEILSIMNKKEDIYSFLRDLISSKEILEFSNRFEVAKMLDEKVSYKEIEEKTKMSSTTIARISKFLKWENNGYKNAINILKSVYSKHHEGHWS